MRRRHERMLRAATISRPAAALKLLQASCERGLADRIAAEAGIPRAKKVLIALSRGRNSGEAHGNAAV